MLNAQPLYYRRLWEARKLPMGVFQQLLSMPEPTDAKWEVMADCARLFLIVLETAPGKEGVEMSMMEEYISFVLDRMRGSADADRPADAGSHPHRLKWRAISAVLASPARLAGLFMTLDLWEFYGARHEFCKSKSKYGGFASGHHRHEMAVRVCKDLVWYEHALKDPASVFKQTEAFLMCSRRRRFVDRIDTAVRESMRRRMRMGLEAGQASLHKWSAKVWTRGRHLLGAVCDEKYRLGVAQLVLILLGHQDRLQVKLTGTGTGNTNATPADTNAPDQADAPCVTLADAAPAAPSAAPAPADPATAAPADAAPATTRSPAAAEVIPVLSDDEDMPLGKECRGGRAAPARTRTRMGPTRVELQPPAPVDEVQAHLFRFIRQRHEEGELSKEWQMWGHGDQVDEWLVLATAGEADTTENPALGPELTPCLYNIFIDMLFVGLSDNTRLESYVSLYKTFCHCNMDGTTVEEMFLYHAGLERERLQLRQPEMRSTCGGARRAGAKAQAEHGKLLPSHARSKKQLRELCRLALARAAQYEEQRKRFFARGEKSLKRMFQADKGKQEGFKMAAAGRMVVSQTATKELGEGGRKRRAEAPPEAYMYLLNALVEPGGEAAKRRGTGYGNDALKVKKSTHTKERKAAAPPPRIAVPKPTKSGGRRTERQLRQLAADRPMPKPKLARKRPARAAAPSAEQLASAGLAAELDTAAAEAEVELRREEAEAIAAAAEVQRREEREADLQRHWVAQAAQREAAAAVAAERERAAAVDREAALAKAEQIRAHERVELEKQIKQFGRRFQTEHGRPPRASDLQARSCIHTGKGHG